MSLTNCDARAKAVVYPAETIAGYGHIASLGREGVEVVALNTRDCPTFSSRYVKESHVVPDPTKDHEGFVTWLADYARTQEVPPVLFMAEDLYAYIVSLYRDVLEPVSRYPFIPPEAAPKFFRKDAMHAAAERAGLLVPKTLYPPLTARAVEDVSFPVVLKPLVARFTFNGRELVDSVRFPRVFGGKAVLAETPLQLAELSAKIEGEGIEYCVQELVPGPNDAIYNIKFVAGPDHRIPAGFISQKVRQQPADFGTCAVARSVFVPDLLEMAEAFVRETRYTGPGCIEFKRSGRDGSWYFIEINPRLDFWVGMAALKGVNLPFQQYLLSTGQPLLHARQREGGRAWIDLFGDIRGLRWRQRKPEWRLTLGQVLKPYLWFDEAVLNFQDPLPGLKRLARALRSNGGIRR